MTTRNKLILVLIVFSALILFITHLYYEKENTFKDPRLQKVGELYKTYDQAVRDNNQQQAVILLEMIEEEYLKMSHYKESFEMAVVYVNKSAIFLTQALTNTDTLDFKENYLIQSESLLLKSLELYKMWENQFKGLDDLSIFDKIQSDFESVDKNKKRIIDNRVEEIKLSLLEMDRRYSVVYTNIGIVRRHQKRFDEAIENYEKAVELWDENYTAKSNISILMGGKPIKRNFIQKMFPPKKN